jgi:NADP-dependent 3-hydroxy acid dehydrogenase YdfG
MNTSTESSERKAVITGASSGIGLATVKAFQSKKIKVFSADIRDPEHVSAGIFHLNTDITKPEDIQRLYTRVNETIGSPDILICNAGRGIHERLSEGDPNKWASVIEINLMGALRVIRAFLPDMIKNQSGDVVFISSVSSQKPYEYGGIYSATKTALEAVAESLRLEVQPQVRVTTIVPGVVNTSFFENIIGGEHSPESLGWGALQPEDVADAIVYAISRPKNMALNKIILRPAAQPF